MMILNVDIMKQKAKSAKIEEQRKAATMEKKKYLEKKGIECIRDYKFGSRKINKLKQSKSNMCTFRNHTC